MFKKFLFTICLILFAGVPSVFAQINVEVDREFTVSEAGEMSVIETESVRNDFADRFIPQGTTRSYYFVISAQEDLERTQIAQQIYSSLNLKINNRNTNFSRLNERSQFGINYSLPANLNPGDTITVEVNYKHPELAEKVGGLLDAYIPAFSDDFSFDFGTTRYRYRTVLKLPQNSGRENILSVEPASKFNEAGFTNYVFAQESLIGAFVWVQRGSEQVYNFEISQTLNATQEIDNGNINEFQLIIPRDMDEAAITQTVYFTGITPEPISISQDEEGNLLGNFRVPAHQTVTVRMSGYAVLSAKEGVDITQAGTLSQIQERFGEFSRYLGPAEYWEVDNSQIIQKANALVANKTQIYPIITDIYEDIVAEIDYSQIKRFGLNERQGALATLNGGAAVCMEYSDLYLSLLRAAGIPARAAFGYGYDSRLGLDEQEPHQWIQIFLPGLDNWISADVTWGEAGPQVIGGDLNHFYTHVASLDPNTPAVLSRLSVSGGSADLVEPRFVIKPLAELPAGTIINSRRVSDLLADYPALEVSESEFLVQNLGSKYLASWRNLFTAPQNLDLVSVGMLILSVILILMLISFFLGVIFNIGKNGYKNNQS